jgi:hypothetical protein
MAAFYEVWMSHGHGLFLGPKFRMFDDAQRYVDEHCDLASHAVKAPDGHWAMIAPKRRSIRRSTFG